MCDTALWDRTTHWPKEMKQEKKSLVKQQSWNDRDATTSVHKFTNAFQSETLPCPKDSVWAALGRLSRLVCQEKLRNVQHFLN